LDGILNIDKPAGITSYGVVARIKRLTGEKRVGHAGTLDPDATGVLPVCLGQGTRIVEYLSEASKTYRATIELGVSTDTYDASGRIIQRGDTSGINLDKVELSLGMFRGTIDQTPPMFSALKYHGRPLYKLAREGINVERQSRPVTIHRLELTEWHQPLLTIEIECSKGTYIRSIAHNLGQALGCGAHLKTLVRTLYGPFNIESSVTLSRLEETLVNGKMETILLPVDYVLRDFPRLTIDDATETAMRQGKILSLQNIDSMGFTAKTRCCAYEAGGRFLGILQYIPDSNLWQPLKVFISRTG
jgi:tRNA pseudouridine55 synthase